MRIVPLDGPLGAEVHGNLTFPLDDEVRVALRAAIHKHLIVFFPDQPMQPEAHVTVARALGELTVPEPPDEITLDDSGFPWIVVAGASASAPSQTKQDPDQANWHHDAQWTATPATYSILSVTQPGDGEAVWADQRSAYHSLSAPMKTFLSGLTARHSRGTGQDRVGHDHPLIFAHPITKQPVLFLGESYTVGINELNASESTALLDFLVEHATNEAVVCRRRFRANDLIIWDNIAALHGWYSAGNAQPGLAHRIEVTVGQL